MDHDDDSHLTTTSSVSTITNCILSSNASTTVSLPTDHTNETNTNDEVDNDLGDYKSTRFGFGCQIKPELDTFGVQTGAPTFTATSNANKMKYEKKNDNTGEEYFQIKMESLIKLKDGTKKLLSLVEDLQTKTHCNNPVPDDIPKLSNMIKSSSSSDHLSSLQVVSATDVITALAMRKLEVQASNLDEIVIQGEDDDCSVFKRLTRKCHCLNNKEYNDFIIHFNEDTKHFTSTLGEVIKNVRILKKFLYMGGAYTKNALTFLIEGLTKCPLHEKVEIIQACSYADMCNVFEEYSIVIIYLMEPCRNERCGDSKTQALTANFLFKLAQVEEGRRYLTFSSKITNDIKRLLRKESSKLTSMTLETLNTTVNLLNPPLTRHINVTYYCKAEEGMGYRTLQALTRYRVHMTLDEVFTHLDLLSNMSERNSGKKELMQHFPNLLSVFKRLLIEYDSSEINIAITNILNNLVAKTPLKTKESELVTTHIVSDMCTEPIPTKTEFNQVPSLKKAAVVKKREKSKLRITGSINKNREPSKRKVEEPSVRQLNKSKKDLSSSIVVVPIEKRRLL